MRGSRGGHVAVGTSCARSTSACARCQAVVAASVAGPAACRGCGPGHDGIRPRITRCARRSARRQRVVRANGTPDALPRGLRVVARRAGRARRWQRCGCKSVVAAGFTPGARGGASWQLGVRAGRACCAHRGGGRGAYVAVGTSCARSAPVCAPWQAVVAASVAAQATSRRCGPGNHGIRPRTARLAPGYARRQRVVLAWFARGALPRKRRIAACRAGRAR